VRVELEVIVANKRRESPGPAGRQKGREPRKAVGTDPKIKADNLRRLKRTEGQIRGIQRMVEDERYCADILTQLAATCRALRAVGTEVLRSHLRHCATKAIKAGPDEAEAMYEELIELVNKNTCG
jgi:DNA-binding FrmR family transcriptional regulator